MRGMIIRICAWYTLITFSLVSLVGLIVLFTKMFSVAGILAFLLCLSASATGWHARKFGLSEFRIYTSSKTDSSDFNDLRNSIDNIDSYSFGDLFWF